MKKRISKLILANTLNLSHLMGLAKVKLINLEITYNSLQYCLRGK